MWRYWNPVEITFGPGSFDELSKLIADRRYALVTYGEPAFAELAERLRDRAGDPVLTIFDVTPNPDMRALSEQCRRFQASRAPPEVIVALGGGSVIDSAKVFAAADGRF